MTILFIENHSIFAQQVTGSFLPAHQVTIVPDLATARTKLATGQYDLVLVDYDLDDGKGDELVREIRAGGSTLRIIGVSAHENGNAALLRAGANTTCSKMEFDRIGEFI